MIVEKVGKMTAHEFSLDGDYENRKSLFIEAECEVVGHDDKPIGEVDEEKEVTKLRIKMAKITPMENGVYEEPELTTTNRKSRSQHHRALLKRYWEQQLSSKYTFKAFYDSVYDKYDQKVEEQLK